MALLTNVVVTQIGAGSFDIIFDTVANVKRYNFYVDTVKDESILPANAKQDAATGRTTIRVDSIDTSILHTYEVGLLIGTNPEDMNDITTAFTVGTPTTVSAVTIKDSATNLQATVVDLGGGIHALQTTGSGGGAITGNVGILDSADVRINPAKEDGNLSTIATAIGGTLTVDGSAVTQPVSGTVTANIGTSGSLALDATLTGGTQKTKVIDGSGNVIGATGNALDVNIKTSATVPVSGTFWQATQPVSGTFWQATQPVSGTFWQATQPVSGSVTANIGTSGSLALDTTVAKLTIAPGTALGTNTQAMVGGSVTTAAPAYTNGQISPLNLNTAGGLRVDGSGVTQPVSGTFWQATQPVSGTFWQATQPVSGSVTANIGTAGTLALASNQTGGSQKTQVVDGSGNVIGATGNALDINIKTSGATVPVSGTFWQATQPVSGAVTANIGTSGSLALDATLTGGTQKAIVRGGAKGTTVATDITSSAQGVDHQGMDVQIRTSAGAVVDTFGGGQQYSDGNARGSAVGTLMMVDDGVNIQSASGTSGGLLKIDLSGTAVNTTALKVDGSAVTQPVSGTFWQATQPVSGTFWQATQPISGSVTANIGTSGSLALDTTVAKLTIAPGTALGTNTQAMVGGSVTTAAPAYTNGQISPLNLNTAGGLRVDGSGVTQPVSGNFWQATQPVSGTFWQATQPVSGSVTANIGTSGSLALDTTVAKLTIAPGTALGTNTQAMVGGSVTTAAPTYTNGQISPLNLSTAGALRVEASQATASSLNAQVVGAVAHDAADSGNPLKVGGRASTTNPTAVADGDRVNAMYTKLGKTVVALNAPRELHASNTITLSNNTETTLLSAGASGVFHDILSLEITTSSTSAIRVDIRDATAGTVRRSFQVAAGGGAVSNTIDPWVQTTAANNWTAQLSGTPGGGGDVRINILAVKNN